MDWGPGVWGLHGLGALYLLGFVLHFLRSRPVERRALAGEAKAVRRFNRMLANPVGSFYGKMLGQRRIEGGRASTRGSPSSGDHQ